MSLITRQGKGSKLTIQEMDGNLEYLDNKVPYKVYTALLNQSGEDAPVAIVLENTLGFEITFNYDPGNYVTNEDFDKSKTIVFITPSTDFSDKPVFAIGYGGTGGNKLIIYTLDDGIYSDNMLRDTSIEIRVYP
jgi:hypothetical protein